jgi:hypothetical protein
VVKKRVMIIGFKCYAKTNDSKEYDYVGVMYPEGLLYSTKNLLFNREQIDEIFHVGFIDTEENKFKEFLNKF